jgi:hypothetical protein
VNERLQSCISNAKLQENVKWVPTALHPGLLRGVLRRCAQPGQGQGKRPWFLYDHQDACEVRRKLPMEVFS